MDEREIHAKLVRDKIKALQDEELQQIDAVRGAMWEYLTQHKGYAPGDIVADMRFKVSVPGVPEQTVSADFLITLGGRQAMFVKCCASSVESSVRHAVALGRSVGEFQIPLCFVTDGEEARFLNVTSGELLSEDIHALPDRDELMRLLGQSPPTPCPPERLIGEKRILLAFETTICPAGGGPAEGPSDNQ